ncbi:hypothetical protein EWM64_g8472 [Hericium alpestre]|uniref:FAD-binding domain-containing protein n=1 Tax=Hericium alpestre TaxID=135208 RepID=A0A4Y9ZQ28_9AGAM|nr:hypothetical protein EWM64_g8472 [Hericium alpestre]
MSTSVLIVGSGPTGLVAALSLAQNGVDVRVIEKLPHFPIGQRGSGIMPRTLEIYHQLGVPEVKETGRSLIQYLKYEDGKPVKEYPVFPHEEATPAYPERTVWLLGQDAACRILREHLKKYGIEVELSTELLNLQQDAEQVTATVMKRHDGEEAHEQITAKYVVGADGAKGIVRKLVSLTFLGETRDALHVLIGDVVATGVDANHWHQFGDAPGDAIMLRPTDRTESENMFFFTACGPSLDYQRALTDHDYLREFGYSVAKMPELKIGEVETIADYRHGRVFVAGDAAHVHSVTGGQGMNSSIMDSFNLSWKLALACKGLATPALLDSYTTERLPVIKEMLQQTTALLNKTFDTKRLKDSGPSPWQRPAALNQLGVHYRWSPIVIDERVQALQVQDGMQAEAQNSSTYIAADSESLRAGDRAHDAPGLVDLRTENTTRLFDIFRTNCHTVLIFTDGAELDPFVKSLARLPKGIARSVAIYPKATSVRSSDSVDLSLRDEEGHAYSAYGAMSGLGKIAVIRPDGVVGAMVGGGEGVMKYFTSVLVV